MKITISVILLFLFFILHAESWKTVKLQDFEGQLPGSVPGGWRRGWGKQGGDFFLISSECSLSGSKSMLVDRMDNKSTSQWGLQTQFPHINEGKIKINFAFLVNGPGNKVWFSFEFRNKSARQRLFALTFKNGKIYLGSYAKGLTYKKRKIFITNYNTGMWYRASLSFPVTPRSGKYVTAKIFTPENPLATKSVKHLMTFPKGKLGVMMLCIAPNKNGYKLFIDDYKVLYLKRLKY